MKLLATGLAIMLQLACWVPPFNTKLTFSVAINGTFYNTRKPHNLASLVYWDGKFLGAFPQTEAKRRGGLVCYKDGSVEAGYFEMSKKGLMWNGARPKWNEIKWAITGGGLFLYNGKPLTAHQVSAKESLSIYITTHKRYAFLLVHNDRKRVTIGVSSSTPPSALAKQFAGKYYAMLRLDGGSATRKIFNSKLPKTANNIVGFPLQIGRANKEE